MNPSYQSPDLQCLQAGAYKTSWSVEQEGVALGPKGRFACKEPSRG